MSDFLKDIDSPRDLKKLPLKALPEVSQEIRDLIVRTVSENGGHLASSLGVTDLTVALHYAFDVPADKIVWDVGHQAYAHKIITGRRDKFHTLRQDGGISGFPNLAESETDGFIAGHAGTAISAALGMAKARDLRDGTEHVLAVVGDGSLGCGISLEALNNVTESAKRFIIILNDNRMSISANVGGMTRYLNKLIGNSFYNKCKTLLKKMLRPIDPYDSIRNMIRRMETAMKRILVPTVYFEELGIRYMGPIDGHNIAELVDVFRQIKAFDRPVMLHIVTTKGKGYKPAMKSPEHFHGVGKFDVTTGEIPSSGWSFSSAFGHTMVELCKVHPDLYAITAAMCSGTGLKSLSEHLPERVMDVGIAEEHAVVFAGGLAVSGLRPVVAIYASFLQRAFDPVFHDICLQNLPVIFCCDRAGVVDDGPTHHGIQDLGFLAALPNLAVLQPKDENELRAMLHAAYERKTPVAIRYPRGTAPVPFTPELPPQSLEWGKSEVVREGKDVVIYALGRETYTALEVAQLLAAKGIEATVVNARFVAPFDTATLRAFTQPIVTIEDHVMDAGLAAVVAREMVKAGMSNKLLCSFGWPNTVLPHATVKTLRRKFALEPALVAEKILEKF